MTAPAVIALPSPLPEKLTALQAKLEAIRNKERAGEPAEIHRALSEELLAFALDVERVGRFTELWMAQRRGFDDA